MKKTYQKPFDLKNKLKGDFLDFFNAVFCSALLSKDDPLPLATRRLITQNILAPPSK